MIDVKTWSQSKTVWAGLGTVVLGVLGLMHIAANPQLVTDILDWLVSVATIVSGGMTIYGRLKAAKRIVPADVAANTNAPTNAILLPLGIAATLLLGGCSKLLPPSEAYIAGDRATFEAVAPEYQAYVATDPLLSDAQKVRRGNTVQTWRLRIEEGEKASAPATQPTNAARP